MIRASHTGDLGDVISMLPSLRALGGGEIVIGQRMNGQRESMRGVRYDSIKPLLEVQPYVSGVEWSNNFAESNISHDFGRFRINYRTHENLAIQHARHFGIEISLEPWLSVPSASVLRATGRVVVCRSFRYHNPAFPWQEIVDKHPDCIFVGLRSEHSAFQQHVLRRVEYVPTENLLELAQLIAQAKLVVSNQTAVWWISVGLGVPTWQETYHGDMNSVINRKNCKYTRTDKEIEALRKLVH